MPATTSYFHVRRGEDAGQVGAQRRPGQKPTVIRSIRIEVELYERLRELAVRHRRNLGQEVNAALAHYVEFLARGKRRDGEYAE